MKPFQPFVRHLLLFFLVFFTVLFYNEYSFPNRSLAFAGNDGPAFQTQFLDLWIVDQSNKSTQSILDNISRPDTLPGVVVASPSRFDPNYYYYWIRDAALTMNVVVSLFESSLKDSGHNAKYAKILADYIALSRRNQLTPNLCGAPDGAGLGEPKFYVDGSAFNEDWGRPQNDGPAIRAIVLIRFLNLLAAKEGRLWSWVSNFGSNDLLKTVIRSDLEFTANHWRDPSFDLWEETKGDHFYTRLLQRRALIAGASLMNSLGDTLAAQWYLVQAGQLEQEIAHHWDPTRGYLVITLNPTNMEYKTSGIDSGVVLGVLHAQGDDGYLGPTDEKVLATAAATIKAFKAIYPINVRESDYNSEPMEAAIGRYPEDTYCGCNFSRLGNPWVLSTDAFAELYFRMTKEWRKKKEIRITAINLGFFKSLLPFRNFISGETIHSNDLRFTEILEAAHGVGDSFLRRVRFHTPQDRSLWEQWNRDTGFMQSAKDLTWSYASFLTAIWQR